MGKLFYCNAICLFVDDREDSRHPEKMYEFWKEAQEEFPFLKRPGYPVKYETFQGLGNLNGKSGLCFRLPSGFEVPENSIPFNILCYQAI